MLAPFASHFAEESWERLGHQGSIFDARWLQWDEALVVEDQVEVVIQVSGKTRGRVSVPRDAERGTGRGGAGGCRGAAFTQGKEVRKVVYVPNRSSHFSSTKRWSLRLRATISRRQQERTF